MARSQQDRATLYTVPCGSIMGWKRDPCKCWNTKKLNSGKLLLGLATVADDNNGEGGDTVAARMGLAENTMKIISLI
ncbi:hypothetical protein Nepgr_013095 [Nepenthes gracilis]|uniref:Uncharacterized protein n=1 Tax=Nepenthes gracilis TaxID=150966 RepID=A0AAD3SIJ3_NEPGR|nr:hypothetical protein Nepgr_013095 [Nepenthes gracilis]